MLPTAITTAIRYSYSKRYNLLFFCLLVVSYYFNFWLFMQLVDRPIEPTIYSSVALHWCSALFLASAFFCFKSKTISLYLLAFIHLYLMANLLYYRTYFTLMPIDSYTMIGNLNGLYDSVVSAIHTADTLLLLPTLLLSISYRFFFKKRFSTSSLAPRMITFSLIMTSIFATIAINLYIERNEVSNLLSDENEFKYDVVDGTSTYGFLHCWAWQVRTAFQGTQELTAAEKSKIETWLTAHRATQDLSFVSSSTNKNLIVLIVESLESFPIGKQLNHRVITPFLNELIRNEPCRYFPNMIPQVNIGHSSDTQLIFNTGLLPPLMGAACFKYPHNSYYTIPEALRSKGYYTCTLLGGNGSFWNQGVVNKNYGFDDLISIEKFTDDESFEMGLTDSTFLDQSATKLTAFRQPFMAQLITLSSHDPYRLIDNRMYFRCPKETPEELSRYLNAVNYVDKCIGLFIAKLKKSGLFQNSIILISGDHHATKQHPAEWSNYITKTWKSDMSRTPFIIINGGDKKTDTSIAGQIDVYPTLLDLMNLHDYPWHGLGNSLLSKGKSAVAVNAQFEAFSNNNSASKESIKKAREAWEISDLIIQHDYFNK